MDILLLCIFNIGISLRLCTLLLYCLHSILLSRVGTLGTSGVKVIFSSAA